jgi:hypothetical protein
MELENKGINPQTLTVFCENIKGKFGFRFDYSRYCYNLTKALAVIAGESGGNIIDPSKSPNICTIFMIECNQNGGSPKCFTGLCEMKAKCLDCPKALIDPERLGKLEPETCAGQTCRIGYRNPITGGGNGYCECKNNMKGLACNEF